MSPENTSPVPPSAPSDSVNPLVPVLPPRLLALSGLMLSGKDFVAQLAGCQPLNPADPIYALAERILGTSDKSAPGVRRFMQLVGQWGWGCVTTDYPLSVERALFIDKLRYIGLDGGWMPFPDRTGMPMDALLDFGRDKAFWINILLNRLEQLVHQQQHKLAWLGSGGVEAVKYMQQQPAAVSSVTRPLNVAVSSVRYAHELEPLRRRGFEHFLVCCSETTRQERMLRKSYTQAQLENTDISEQLARELETTLEDHRIIWNDTRPMPAGKNYLSVEGFVKLWRDEVAQP